MLGTNVVVVKKASASEDLVAAMPYNSSKEHEHGYDNAVAPPPGATVEPGSSTLTASTTTEKTGSAKTGGTARLGTNATVASLDPVRVDATGQPLTTNQGVRIGDNQNTLKADCVGHRYSKISFFEKKSRISITNESRNESSMHAAQERTDTSKPTTR